MSFGFGVGDFLAVLGLATKLRDNFVNAPSEWADLDANTADLEDLLRDLIDIVLPRAKLSNDQRAAILQRKDHCQLVLDDLNKFVDNHSELRPVDPTVRRSKRERARRCLKRFDISSKEVQELRQRLIASTEQLNSLYLRLNSTLIYETHGEVQQLEREVEAVNEGVNRIDNSVRRIDGNIKTIDDSVQRLHGGVQGLDTEVQNFARKAEEAWKNEEEAAILDWFAPASISDQQNDLRLKRQAGTGSWFLTSEEYTSWRNGHVETLVCPGIPGAGKTYMSSIVVDDLWSTYDGRNDILSAHLYMSYKRTDQHDVPYLICCLLRQLLQNQSPLPREARAVYATCKKKGARPTASELMPIFDHLAGTSTRIFIIIDALDESQERARKTLLDYLFKLQKEKAKIFSILATTRHIPEILNRFADASSLEISASQEDVNTFLEEAISTLPPKISRNDSLCDEIKKAIVDTADGMFLLAQLHLGSLIDKTTPTKVRMALKSFRGGSEGLSSAYNDARDRIDSQLSEHRKLAKQVLGWISHAKRVLTVPELQHAIASTPGVDHIDDEDDLEDAVQLVSVCAGLVTVDAKSNTVRLVHYTTQEYLVKIRNQWLPNALTEIAKNCLACLLLDFLPGHEEVEVDDDTISADPKTDSHQLLSHRDAFLSCGEEQRKMLVAKYPFKEYAAEWWGEHVTDVKMDDSVMELALELIHSDRQWSQTLQIWDFVHYNPWSPYGLEYDLSTPAPSSLVDPVQYRIPRMHALAHFGLCELARRYSHLHAELNAKDVECRTPLSYAASAGHVPFVQYLLAMDGVDVNSRSLRHMETTPLIEAVFCHNSMVVDVLLQHADVDVGIQNDFGRNALHEAAGLGDYAIVKSLLQRPDIDVNVQDLSGQTPLALATLWKHTQIVKLLLEREDTNVNTQDSQARTPLLIAVKYDQKEIAQLFLGRRDVNVNMKDEFGMTPLWYAASDGVQDLLEKLLERDDIQPDLANNHGRTPLMAAARNRHVNIVNLLTLRNDVDITLQSLRFVETLEESVQYPNVDVVKAIIAKHDAHLSLDSYDLRIRLWVTTLRLQPEKLYHLFGCFVDNAILDLTPNLTDLINEAMEGNKQEVLRLLLAPIPLDGKVVNAKDSLGKTPIAHAIEAWDYEAALTLIEREDVILNITEQIGRELFSAAAHLGNVNAAMVLLNHDRVVAALHATDSWETSPLILAAREGHFEVAALLIPFIHREEVKEFVKNGRTPLHEAVIRGHIKMVILLVSSFDAQPWIHSKDGAGNTPLSLAMSRGQWEIAQVLFNLVEHGRLAEFIDASGRTPLMLATSVGATKVVELLLARSDAMEFVNRRDKWGQEPLILAAKKGFLEISRILLEHMDDDYLTHCVDDFGRTPLLEATRRQHTELIELLLSRKGCANWITYEDVLKISPLGVAIRLGNQDIVDILQRCAHQHHIDVDPDQ